MQPEDDNDVRLRFDATLGGSFELIRRETRWLALADELIGCAAGTDTEWRRLEVEAWLLQRWHTRGIPVPRVVRHDHARKVQLRERLHGLTGHDIHSESSRSPL